MRHFRCFRELNLEGLARFNLFVGQNNVGKTAILEALFIHFGVCNPELTLRVHNFRGLNIAAVAVGGQPQAPWDWLFHNVDTSQQVVLDACHENSNRRTVRLREVREPAKLSEIIHCMCWQYNGG